jgi:transposase
MAENGTINMNQKEIKRSEILKMAVEKRITQKEGAQRIGISERHLRRLLAQYREGGPEAIVSRQRGKMSNNRMSNEKREKVLENLKTEYEGFGPTLAS